MNREQAIRAIAGSFIIVSLLLTKYFDPRWVYMTWFVGLNLLQSAFSGFCLMDNILKAIGVKSELECCNKP